MTAIASSSLESEEIIFPVITETGKRENGPNVPESEGRKKTTLP